MQHAARLPAPRSGIPQTRLPAPHESIFAVLAELARRLSEIELATIAVVSGAVPLTAAASGGASWMLLAGCYVIWSFASWGIFFGPTARRPTVWRALELLMVGSATVVFSILGIGVFFWALGSHWQL
ncbi:MAG: hypothetical protein ABI311_07350 [Gemmatimonadaceae bacterium]